MTEFETLELLVRAISAVSLNTVIGFFIIVNLDDDGHHVRWLNAAPSRWALILALELWPLVVWSDARRYWNRDK